MWTQIEPGIAIHTDGFKVIDLGCTVKYIEKDHIAEFVADPGGRKWIILLKHVNWNPPHQQEAISETKKQQIRLRIVDALRFLNSFCDFDFEH